MPFRERFQDRSLLGTHPVYVLLIVSAILFLTEGFAMLTVPMLPPMRAWVLALLDASVVVAAAVPAMWFFVLVPARRLYRARGLLLRQMFEIQERERATLASDLHDEVGQNLTTVIVGLKTIEDAKAFSEAIERARQLRQSASLGLDEVRRLARGLRPGVLVDLGLTAAVERLCEDFEKINQLRVTLTIDLPCGQRSVMIETAIYRVLQELLTNVSRHARASQVEVSLSADDEEIRLRVEDNGCGIVEKKVDDSRSFGESFGLSSIRERARVLGGIMYASSIPGRGTAIDVRLPVQIPNFTS